MISWPSLWNMTQYNRRHKVLDPYGRDPAFERATAEYISQFEYQVTVRLGPSYSKEFKEFSDWCNAKLGTKFRDWFIMSSTKNEYVLYCRSNKWAMFLALTHIDKIV